MKAIYIRRSIRKFRPEAIEREAWLEFIKARRVESTPETVFRPTAGL